MNLPTRAQDAHAALAAAYNTGDLNTVLSMYDVTGIMVAEPDKPVTGRAGWEAAVKGILSIKGKMDIKTVYCLQTGDVAVGRSEWSITDGEEVKVSARGIEVLMKQPDGTWKIIVDHAFGAETSLSPL
jgi:ketosteroid isomerase-like protein